MSKSLASAGIKLSILTLGSRILGLVREMTKATFLGTSGLADAFGVAFMIPNLFRRLFAENSISVAFIPTFKKYLEENPENKQSTKEFINATFTLVSFLTTIVVTIGIIFSPWIVKLFSNGESSEILMEMSVLTRIMFPYLIVISIAALFQGILNGLKIFSPSGFTPILFNLCVIIATYVLSPYTKNPARAMAYGVLLGGIIQAGFQLPFVIKNGWGVKNLNERLTTGIKDLDDEIDPLLPGDLMIITSDGPFGKTSLALNFIAKGKHPNSVLYFSLEQPSFRVYKKLIDIDDLDGLLLGKSSLDISNSDLTSRMR